MNKEEHFIKFLNEISLEVNYLKSVVDFLNESRKSIIDANFSVGVGEPYPNVKVFNLEIDFQPIKVDIIFWITNDERFTIMLDGREILDEYLTKNSDAIYCKKFLASFLSHNIEIDISERIKDKKTFNKTYSYFIVDSSGNEVLFQEKSILSFNLFLNKFESRKMVILPIL